METSEFLQQNLKKIKTIRSLEIPYQNYTALKLINLLSRTPELLKITQLTLALNL